MFNFDPGTAHAEFEQSGYVHLRGILKPEVVQNLSDFLNSALQENADEKGEWRISGKKRQFLYEFPNSDWAEEFRCGMAALTGIGHDDFTISERHLKVYDRDVHLGRRHIKIVLLPRFPSDCPCQFRRILRHAFFPDFRPDRTLKKAPCS